MKNFKEITIYSKSMQYCCKRMESAIHHNWIQIKLSASILFEKGLHAQLVLINPDDGYHIEIEYCPLCGKRLVPRQGIF